MWHHATDSNPQFLGAHLNEKKIGDYQECVLAMGRQVKEDTWMPDDPGFGIDAESIERAAEAIDEMSITLGRNNDFKDPQRRGCKALEIQDGQRPHRTYIRWCKTSVKQIPPKQPPLDTMDAPPVFPTPAAHKQAPSQMSDVQSHLRQLPQVPQFKAPPDMQAKPEPPPATKQAVDFKSKDSDMECETACPAKNQ